MPKKQIEIDISSITKQNEMAATPITPADLKALIDVLTAKVDSLAADNGLKHIDVMVAIDKLSAQIGTGAAKRTKPAAATGEATTLPDAAQDGAAPATAPKAKAKGKGKDANSPNKWFTDTYTNDEAFRTKVRALPEVQTVFATEDYKAVFKKKATDKTKIKCECDNILNHCGPTVARLHAESTPLSQPATIEQ